LLKLYTVCYEKSIVELQIEKSYNKYKLKIMKREKCEEKEYV